ncbi:MAG: tetratricopeptide repeat protein [Chloroflexi bacterium]|nr:tetratricopeptide repeat protein [Chloroflexota bacterium]
MDVIEEHAASAGDTKDVKEVSARTPSDEVVAGRSGEALVRPGADIPVAGKNPSSGIEAAACPEVEVADGEENDGEKDETVSLWLAGSVVLALIIVFIFAGLVVKSLYIDQPVARTAVERDIFRYKGLIEKNPKDLDARLNLASAYAASKDYEAARAQLNEVVKQDDRRSKPHELLAEIYRQNGDPNRAIAEYRQAIMLDPVDELAYYQLGQIYLVQTDYARAAEMYKKLVAINPTVADAHYYLGLSYEKLGDREQAQGQYREALKYILDYSEAKEGLARVSSR